MRPPRLELRWSAYTKAILASPGLSPLPSVSCPWPARPEEGRLRMGVKGALRGCCFVGGLLPPQVCILPPTVMSCQRLAALVLGLDGVTWGHGSSRGSGLHSWRERPRRGGAGEVSQGGGPGPRTPHPADGSLLPRLTMGLSCPVPASPASSGLPVPSGPFDCPHLFAHGGQRVSSGPGPSCSLGSSNFHPWLFVLMFYPIHERWVSKDIREDGVQTSCPEQIWGGVS